MKGSIFSDEHCPICGLKLRDNRKNAVTCPKHPEVKAGSFRVHFQGTWRRFSSYEEAAYFLNGLRYKYTEGTYDERDYKRDNPLSFETLANKYLNKQRTKVRCFRNVYSHLSRAIDYFGEKNIKTISYGDIEDFLDSQTKLSGGPLSEKTLHNIKTTLHAFFVWAHKRERSISVPDFPETRFTLSWRRTVSLDVQDKIINEIYKICSNKKVWFGVYLLSTYPKVRPIELLNVKEKDIYRDSGIILIRKNKEGKDDKILRLTEQDTEILTRFPQAIDPELYFFRHTSRGYLSGKRFGKDLFYSYWKKACKNLGIVGVDLYGGTKHSTVRAMREFFSPSEIKQGTGIVSNVAFERYFQHDVQDDLKISLKRNELRSETPQKLPFHVPTKT